jgi:excisionase family DNA binding protein
MSSQILTVEEAAERLKLKPAGVRRLIRVGALQATKLGKGYRILDSEVERAVAAGDREGGPT